MVKVFYYFIVFLLCLASVFSREEPHLEFLQKKENECSESGEKCNKDKKCCPGISCGEFGFCR